MEKNPFTFDAKNPRLVTDRQRNSLVYAAAGAIWVGSMMWYNKRYFRVDQNAMNMLAFTAASIPASFAYANFALSDPETEAACINNERELQQ